MFLSKKINRNTLILISIIPCITYSGANTINAPKKDSSVNTLTTKTTKNGSGSFVVTVSGQAVMQNSETGKEIQETLKNQQAKLTAALEKDQQTIINKSKILKEKNDALSKKAAELERSTLLSEEAKDNKRKELRDEVRALEEDKAELERLDKRLQMDVKQLDAEMGQFYQKELAKFDTKIKDVINDVATQNGWDIVLMEESVIYSNNSQTDLVIKELDRRYKPATKKPDLTNNSITNKINTIK